MVVGPALGGSLNLTGGTVPRAHAPNSRSARRTTSSTATSPTTTSVALLGRKLSR
jgi:hypothetical protein